MTEELSTVLGRAAGGDVASLIAMCRYTLQLYDVPVRERLVAAEVFAHLAAATGSWEGRRELSDAFCRRGWDLAEDDPARSYIFWQNSCVTLYDLALEGDVEAAATLLVGLESDAAEGDEETAVYLNQVIETLSPDVLQRARKSIEKSKAVAALAACEQSELGDR